MTNTTTNSFLQFQPITVLPGYKPPPPPALHESQQPEQHRTPSPAETAATISESFSTTTSSTSRSNSHNAMNMMMTMTTSTTTEDYSHVPVGLEVSSQSTSPGSASDHMGVLPTTVMSGNSSNSNSHHGVKVQPLFPGSSVLAAFDAGNPNLAYGPPQPHQPPQQQHQVGHILPLSSTTSNTSIGITVKSPVLTRRKGGGTTNTAGKATSAAAAVHSNAGITDGTQPGNPNRRQSRLQRNRESARLSRKRRKQYLELLEERVDKLSETLDGSRRRHVAAAVTTLHQKRIEYILQYHHTHDDTTATRMLENNLSRTNEELMIATTFQYQQLKSFSIPPSLQFTLWLTLQTDTYFRGGRTASERLSAARIGERVRVILLDTHTLVCYFYFGVVNIVF